ncbi:MAG: hypothetical protein Q4C46_00320 [Bacillota bacterium]|nr:hypothetical protein [Bacillota bacterium]
MLYDLYHFLHNSIGICFWELPALLVAIIMVVVIIVHSRNQKKRENEYEKQREEKLEALRSDAQGSALNA